MSAHVFVYGTLRRGGSNEFRMEDADYLAPASVRGRLYRVAWYPALILDSSAQPVIGDLWSIPESLLEPLDAYEGDEYGRIRSEVTRQDTGELVEVWLWEWRDAGSLQEGSRIGSGNWMDTQH